MASSIRDVGRKLADRAKTVVGDDWGEVKRRSKAMVREERAQYSSLMGKPERSKARKPSSRSGR